MPAELDWLDESRRIFALRLYDPLSPPDFETIEADLTDIVETQQPLYILLDIRNAGSLGELVQMANTDNRPYLPELSPEQRERSRFAILGGGALVRLIFNLVEHHADESQQFVHQFEYEDRAYSWLSEQATQG